MTLFMRATRIEFRGWGHLGQYTLQQHTLYTCGVMDDDDERTDLVAGRNRTEHSRARGG